jgi:nitroreductase
MLDLTPDELLSTTRAVRKRLDFNRPVEAEAIRECVALAMQAPSGSNNMTMRFMVIQDAAKRAAIGDVYRQCYEIYRSLDGIYIGSIDKGSPEENAQQARSTTSADFLADHLGEAPAIVIGCANGVRADGLPAMMASSALGNVMPGMWSFMLAARARGLGTAWTTIHLMQEKAVADLLGIPFDTVQQVALTPLAYTVGTDFKPAARPAPDSIISWDTW